MILIDLDDEWELGVDLVFFLLPDLDDLTNDLTH